MEKLFLSIFIVAFLSCNKYIITNESNCFLDKKQIIKALKLKNISNVEISFSTDKENNNNCLGKYYLSIFSLNSEDFSNTYTSIPMIVTPNNIYINPTLNMKDSISNTILIQEDIVAFKKELLDFFTKDELTDLEKGYYSYKSLPKFGRIF